MYEGEQNILLVNDIHQGLLSLFLQEFIRKNKFETQKDEQEFPFIVMLKCHLGEIIQEGDELTFIWTEFARNLPTIPDYSHMFNCSSQKSIEQLAQKTVLYYNKLDYKTKVKVKLLIKNFFS